MQRRSEKRKTRGDSAADSNGNMNDHFQDMLVESKESFHTIIRRYNFELNEDAHFQGKHSDVIMADRLHLSSAQQEAGDEGASARVMEVTPHVALKSQYIGQPHDILDQSYRELLVYKTLSKLAEENRCPNFIRLFDWFKSQGDFFDTDSEDDNDSSSPPSENEQSKRRYKKSKKKHQFMNFILEKADSSLNEYLLEHNNTMSLEMYKQTLFQILFSLNMAQEHCEFVHNDLHLKNILLKALPENVNACMFIYHGTQWILDAKTMPFLVKINGNVFFLSTHCFLQLTTLVY